MSGPSAFPSPFRGMPPPAASLIGGQTYQVVSKVVQKQLKIGSKSVHYEVCLNLMG